MSGHMSKCLQGESTGRLTEDELCQAAGLLHGALVYDQNRFIVEKIARQLRGKNMAVHAGEVLAQIGAMNDSSKSVVGMNPMLSPRSGITFSA